MVVSPDSKVHGANMEPIWGRQNPGGPHVGPMNFAVWEVYLHSPEYIIQNFYGSQVVPLGVRKFLCCTSYSVLIPILNYCDLQIAYSPTNRRYCGDKSCGALLAFEYMIYTAKSYWRKLYTRHMYTPLFCVGCAIDLSELASFVYHISRGNCTDTWPIIRLNLCQWSISGGYRGDRAD